ncbi:hypothetical protein BaRGS_00029423, partial [Batillaria attramentaria]
PIKVPASPLSHDECFALDNSSPTFEVYWELASAVRTSYRQLYAALTPGWTKDGLYRQCNLNYRKAAIQVRLYSFEGSNVLAFRMALKLAFHGFEHGWDDCFGVVGFQTAVVLAGWRHVRCCCSIQLP